MKNPKLHLLFLITVLLLFFPSCKSVINISGTWTGAFIFDNGTTYTANYTFSGDENSGTLAIYVSAEAVNGTGTYTVNDPAVNLNVTWDTGVVFTATGTIVDENNMNGTFTMTNANNGSWTATR